MKKILSPLALTALVLVAACKDEPEVIDRTPLDPMSDELNNAGAVVLPPMVKLSKTFRCKDGSLLFVDYMNDDKTAMVKTEKEGVATPLIAEEAGKPFTAEGGWSVTGPGDVIDTSIPGKGSQSCKS
ncbi:MAG: hypothetical protein AB7U35_04070 [Sphingobium sp.]